MTVGLPPATVTKVGFGVTSVIGYLTTAVTYITVGIQALEGVHISSGDPLVLIGTVSIAVTTFIRGIQGAAKAHANNPGS